MQNHLKSIRSLLLAFLAFTPFYGFSQMPTHVDPGIESDPVSLKEHPEYIVLIVLLIGGMLLFYFISKRNKARKQKDKSGKQ